MSWSEHGCRALSPEPLDLLTSMCCCFCIKPSVRFFLTMALMMTGGAGKVFRRETGCSWKRKMV